MAFKIPDSTIDEIKSRIDLGDLFSNYGIELKRAGADYVCCCPFHHEKTPSMHVHVNEGYYKCFGCGKSGNAFGFVMEHDGLSFVEAARKLADMCGVKIEEKEDPEAKLCARLYALHAELSAFYTRCLRQAKEAEAARAYLSSRKYPDGVVEDFGIGYAPQGGEAILKWAKKYGFTPAELQVAGVLRPPSYAGGNWYHIFGGRLVLTIRDKIGRAIGFSGRILTNEKKIAKYVNSPETPVFKKSKVLYAFDKAAGKIAKAQPSEAIICEGQFDVIRCHVSGFDRAVASQGTAFTPEHAAMLKKVADSVVLVFDGDAAGQKAALKTGACFLALETPVRVARLPEDHDPDSLLRDEGSAAFQKCLDEAESITTYQIRKLMENEKTEGRNPLAIDSVTRISHKALEMIAMCPSAIMRSSLMRDVVAVLPIPLSALEEDFGKIRASTMKKAEKIVSRAAGVNAPLAASNEGDSDDPPPEFFNEGMIVTIEEAVPPSPEELAFCQFLYAFEYSQEMRNFNAMLSVALPPEVLAHEFTRKFVFAWRQEAETGKDAFAPLRKELSPVMQKWFDGIVIGEDRSFYSELSPEVILQDYMRRIWCEAFARERGKLPVSGGVDIVAKRLGYAKRIREFRQLPWQMIFSAMNVETLYNP